VIPFTDEIMEGLSRNTREAYSRQWLRFVGWLERRVKPTSLPVDGTHIREYLREVADAGKAASTLMQICKAIDCFHTEADLPKPCSAPSVKKALKSLRLKVRNAPRQAHPLTEEDLQAIIRTATNPRPWGPNKMETKEHARRRGAVDIALIRTMRDAQLRRSEAEVLKWSDLTWLIGGDGLLSIPYSKTDQGGEGALQYLGADTMKALKSIKKFRGKNGFVFGLSAAQISRRIKAACRAAGLDGNYSGHSPRVGMAVDMVRADLSLAAVQQAGRWKSPSMVQRYTRSEIAQRGAVARWYAKQEKRTRAGRANSFFRGDRGGEIG